MILSFMYNLRVGCVSIWTDFSLDLERAWHGRARREPGRPSNAGRNGAVTRIFFAPALTKGRPKTTYPLVYSAILYKNQRTRVAGNVLSHRALLLR